MREQSLEARLFEGWPHCGHEFIIEGARHVGVCRQAQAECDAGRHDGPFHQMIDKHNAACEAMLRLAGVRLEWVLAHRCGDAGEGRKP